MLRRYVSWGVVLGKPQWWVMLSPGSKRYSYKADRIRAFFWLELDWDGVLRSGPLCGVDPVRVRFSKFFGLPRSGTRISLTSHAPGHLGHAAAPSLPRRKLRNALVVWQLEREPVSIQLFNLRYLG